jgi:hypothetical protein
MLAVDSFPSASERSSAREELNWLNFPTIHNNSPMPDKTVDNVESLSSGRPSLVQGEPIQPLESCLDGIPSPRLLRKFLCVALSQVSYQPRRTY